MWKPESNLSKWLKGAPQMSFGAYAWLSARRAKRAALPFTPIQAFGLMIETNNARLVLEPGVEPSGEGNAD